ncbi:unnamed protein product [Ceutorhynchus assimilis]|uniref:Uncharacterized protein n=1 Tax=Ceutorhynchus assimilis TaxID=467358 RepID=A0A9N9QNH4_9CUCU|nr:unnamed protein product [Ceutorhynchus assimilis]
MPTCTITFMEPTWTKEEIFGNHLRSTNNELPSISPTVLHATLI